MKTYISVGIGDMVCVDSILSQQERESISEMYWACRFGKDLIPLFENNPYYPNLKNHHIISDSVGSNAMKEIESHATSFWHFRPDFDRNFSVGKSLFELSDINTIDAAELLSSSRQYNNSSFLLSADETSVPWDLYNIEPKKYLVVHYPTSTRPRGDIAIMNDQDWNFIKTTAIQNNLKVVIITDMTINTSFNDAIILYKPPITTVVGLIKFCSFYMGCDSFCSILAVKAVDKSNIYIKSHNPNIQSDVLSNVWTQKYFLPLSPTDISQIYKNFIG